MRDLLLITNGKIGNVTLNPWSPNAPDLTASSVQLTFVMSWVCRAHSLLWFALFRFTCVLTSLPHPTTALYRTTSPASDGPHT